MIAGSRHRIVTRRSLVGALAAFGLYAASPAMAQETMATATATARSPARISASIPAGDAGTAMLEIAVTSFRKPPTGNIGGVVRLRKPGAMAVEVGRFSIFPAQSFDTAPGDEARRFRFAVADALKQLGLSGGSVVEVVVALVERAGGGVPGVARLVVGSAQIAPR